MWAAVRAIVRKPDEGARYKRMLSPRRQLAGEPGVLDDLVYGDARVLVDVEHAVQQVPALEGRS